MPPSGSGSAASCPARSERAGGDHQAKPIELGTGGIMRTAIYARYSTDLQSTASIEDQMRLCRERIEREGWELVATYSDRGLSGASHLRPGYQQLLLDARAKQFDVVVAEALDRISRDQEHVTAFYKQLSSTSAASYGTACAMRRIQRPASGYPSSTPEANGSRSICRTFVSSTSRFGARSNGANQSLS
jgi:hypothetical protein